MVRRVRHARDVRHLRLIRGAHRRRRRTASARTRSNGVVTLNASAWPGTVCTGRPSASTSPASSVDRQRGVGGGVRLGQDVAGEALRGLHRAQRRAVDGRGHHVAVDGLDGVGDRQHRHHGRLARAHRVHDRLDELDRRQGARGVVHQDDRRSPPAARPGPARRTPGVSRRRRRPGSPCRTAARPGPGPRPPPRPWAARRRRPRRPTAPRPARGPRARAVASRRARAAPSARRDPGARRARRRGR